MLDDLNIYQPARSQLLERNSPPSQILAWLLESYAHEHIQNKIGFVISMLLSGSSPPSAVERLVHLSVEQWCSLAGAARSIRTTGRASLSPSLAGEMETLLSCLGHLEPRHWPVSLPPLEPPVSVSEDAPQPESASSLGDSSPGTRELWLAALRELQLTMPQSVFDALLRGSQVAEGSGDLWVVRVKSLSAVDWLEKRHLSSIQRTLRRLSGREVRLRFVGPE
jgi:hypothetical protein